MEESTIEEKHTIQPWSAEPGTLGARAFPKILVSHEGGRRAPILRLREVDHAGHERVIRRAAGRQRQESGLIEIEMKLVATASSWWPHVRPPLCTGNSPATAGPHEDAWKGHLSQSLQAFGNLPYYRHCCPVF